MKKDDRKFIFGSIFGFGLILCLLSDEIFSHTSIPDVNALVFSILFTLFGGSGLLITIFKDK